MRKIEKIITVNNYSDYATLTYMPSFLNNFKRRVRITDAILKLSINSYNLQADKYCVYFVDNGNEYLVDENDKNINRIKGNKTNNPNQITYGIAKCLNLFILLVFDFH